MRRLTEQVLERLQAAILGLRDQPRPPGVRKLRGTDFTYRVRVGDYRVAYDVYDSDGLIVILVVDRRNESTYRGL